VTGGDFRQHAGALTVGGNLAAQIGGNWTLGAQETGEKKVVERAHGVSDTDIRRAVGSSVTVGGTTAITVGQDLNAQGAQIDLGGSGTIAAAGNVTLSAASATSIVNSNSAGDEGNRRYAETLYASDQTLTGTTLSSGGNLALVAGQDVNVMGSTIRLDQGNAMLAAGGDVNLGVATETHQLNAHETHSRSGVLSGTKAASGIDQTITLSQGSTISADGVTVASGNDIQVTGSNIVGTNDVTLKAARDVNIVTSKDSAQSSTYDYKKQTGLLSNGGLSVSVGSRSTSDQAHTADVTHTGSMIGALNGDLNVIAGNDLKATGSVLHAGHDIALAGKTVQLDSAYDTMNQAEQYQFHQSGLTVGITNPVVSAVQTGRQMANAAKHVSGDARLIALSAVTTGLAAKNLYDAVGGNPVAAAASIGINVGIGQSKSDSQSQAQSSTAVGNTVSAGRNATLMAAGAGKDSRIDVIGSTISAGHDAQLVAEGDVNLQAAQSTSSQHGTNSGSSQSVGVSFSVGANTGVALNASVAGNRGQVDGDSSTWTNTHVTAGNQLSIDSGNDTNLKGAVVSGQQVIANVGGNLKIESLQDLDRYDSKQQSAGVSVSVCVPPCLPSIAGSVGQTKMYSDYASVTEQTGIKAGDGGFQIGVQGNTDLKGGVIASSDGAITDEKNSLTTGTLTHSDIENHAEYDASQLAFSGGYGGTIGKDQKGKADNANPVPDTKLPSSGGFSVAPPVVLSASDDAHSVTQSGVSGGTIDITDNAKQQAQTGQTAEDAIASINRDTSDTEGALTPIFNKEKIEAGFEIVGQLVNQVGTFLTNRAAEADIAKAAAKNSNLTPEQRAQAEAKAEELAQWGPGGTYRRVATALTAAAGGNVTGSAGQFVQNASVTYLQTLGAEQVKTLAPYIGGEGSLAHTALHAVLGCAGGAAASGNCGAGALGASAGVVLNTALDQLSKTEGLSASEKEARANLVTSLVAGIAQAVDTNAAQATTAVQVETLYNRLLEPKEAQKLQALQKDKSPEEQQRLADAACALIQCSAGLPASDPYKAVLIASEQRGQQYTEEQTLLRSNGDMFAYGRLDGFNDAMDRYQFSNRAIGAVQGVTGAAAVAAMGAGCATGVGCGLGALVAGTSLDYANAGFGQLVNGSLTSTQGEKLLQGLGFSSEAASLTYGALNLAGTAGSASVMNQASKEANALNEAARLSYTTEKFGAKGILATPEIMKTPQVQAMLDTYVIAGVPSDRASGYISDLLRTGSTLPKAVNAGANTELIKVVPKGIGGSDTIHKNSPYFMTRTEYDALSKLPPQQIANKLGLPAEQAIRGSQIGFDVYSMKPIQASNPTVFTSTIAPVQQGSYSAMGGAQQVLVPNRNQWTDPHLNKIGEILGDRR